MMRKTFVQNMMKLEMIEMSWEEVIKQSKDVGFTGFNKPWNIDAKDELEQESLDADAEGRMDMMEPEPFSIEDAIEQIHEANHRIEIIKGQITWVQKGHAKREMEELHGLIKDLKESIKRERSK